MKNPTGYSTFLTEMVRAKRIQAAMNVGWFAQESNKQGIHSAFCVASSHFFASPCTGILSDYCRHTADRPKARTR